MAYTDDNRPVIPTVPSDDLAAPADNSPDKPAGGDTPRGTHPRGYRPTHAHHDDKKGTPKTAIIIIALFIAFIGVTIGVVVFLMNRPVVESDPGISTGKETVTINDSVLGTVEIQPVEGATLNTYDKNGLVQDENGFYSYYEDGVKVSEMGVDLSEYQGDIDFAAVKASGIDFVILRIGGRYYSEEGALYSDGAFESYYEQAKAAGLKVGAYFFSQAASVEDAVEEAKYALQLLGNKTLDYPVAFDWETIEDDTARTDGIDGATLTAIAEAFCDAIHEGGREAIVYASTSLMLQSYDFETMKDYDFWLADYREFPDSEKMCYNFKMWQYATDGEVDGVSGPVDLNLCLKAY